MLAGRSKIDERAAFLPDWTDNIDDCDGFACIRWRIILISNLISGTPAKLYGVRVPVVDSDPNN